MCESVCVCVHETPRDEEQLVYQGDGWGGPILKHPPPPATGFTGWAPCQGSKHTYTNTEKPALKNV